MSLWSNGHVRLRSGSQQQLVSRRKIVQDRGRQQSSGFQFFQNQARATTDGIQHRKLLFIMCLQSTRSRRYTAEARIMRDRHSRRTTRITSRLSNNLRVDINYQHKRRTTEMASTKIHLFHYNPSNSCSAFEFEVLAFTTSRKRKRRTFLPSLTLPARCKCALE